MTDSSTPQAALCTLCGSPARRVYTGMSGYVQGTHYDIYECTVCLSSHVDPMSNLQEEYDSIYGKNNQEEDAVYGYYYYLSQGVKKIHNPLRALFDYTAIYWGVEQALKENNIPETASVLEVGSGLGYFTYALHTHGYHAHGLEYSGTATAYARKMFGDLYTQGTIEAYAATHEHRYDVVVATEVIEHVVDPVAFIAACTRALKPGGIIIITTPNKDVHPRGVLWETDYAPKHLWWFTEEGIRQVATQCSASCSFVDFTPYKQQKRYTLPVGTAGAPPYMQPMVDASGVQLVAERKGYKARIMRIIPASLYIRLVGLYHACVLPKKEREKNRYMYCLCAIIQPTL